MIEWINWFLIPLQHTELLNKMIDEIEGIPVRILQAKDEDRKEYVVIQKQREDQTK